MPIRSRRFADSMPRFFRHGRLLLAGAGAFAALAGCEFDSWMDPSVVGRWEDTAVTVPILDRIAVVETDQEDFIETTPVQSSDLIAEPATYEVGPGDVLTIDVFELFDPGRPYIVQRVVDDTGNITMPLIGKVYVAGLTESEIRDRIVDLLDPDFVRDPVVSVVSETRQQNSYNVIGLAAVQSRFLIPQPNFRLLDAIAAAGGIADSVQKIHVIRQVPLRTEVYEGHVPGRDDAPQPEGFEDLDGAPMTPPDEGTPTTAPSDEEQDILEMIDEATGRTDEDEDGGGSPGVLGSGGSEWTANIRADANAARNAERLQPAIDLPPPTGGTRPEEEGDWVYLEGRWVRVARPSQPEGAAGPEETGEPDVSQLITQRVIEIPVRPLLDGVAAYNIVIRPNDIIRVPSRPGGIVHITGEAARPGTITIPPSGRLTLKRAIAGVGGLGPLAIPERVEIHRFLNDNREGIVTLNFRAIMEGAEPDVYLKPDDLINIGTTWYAAPLAVIRNGFRTTYGFGFLLDRNFGNDVFGAPPTDRFGN